MKVVPPEGSGAYLKAEGSLSKFDSLLGSSSIVFPNSFHCIHDGVAVLIRDVIVGENVGGVHTSIGVGGRN